VHNVWVRPARRRHVQAYEADLWEELEKKTCSAGG
jgi:hypothetical protein